jgi:hypothetical protein
MATPSYASSILGQYRRAALSAIALARQNARQT